MAKFDFENTTYARFWTDSDLKFLSRFIDETDAIRTNFGFAFQQFSIASAMTPMADDGTATFTVKAINKSVAPMAEMRAPLGDSIPLDKEGVSFYSATIPQFIAPGIVETALERQNKRKQYEVFGNDADLVAQWVDNVQMQTDSLDSTLSHMAAQLLSKGNIIYKGGRGIKGGVHKAEIPTKNFMKAGDVAWTDPDCKILTQMAEIEKIAREESGYMGSMKWQVTYDMFVNVILENQQVKDTVRAYRELNKEFIMDDMVLNEAMFRTAIASYPNLSPIEIVVEKQRNLTHTKNEFVHGWEAGIAVLRPIGFAGDIQRTPIVDVELAREEGNNLIQVSSATLRGGLYTLMNTITPNGNYSEYHTDMMMACVPSLSEFPYHFIIDTMTPN